jgi:hypothetical protein
MCLIVKRERSRFVFIKTNHIIFWKKDAQIMKSEKRISKKNRNSTIVACNQIHVSYIKIKAQEVVLSIEATRCKSEGSGFDSWWSNWKFSLTKSFRPHYGREVDTASNRNEYQEYLLGGKGGRYVRLTTLPPSYADCLEIWQPQTSETLWVCNRHFQGLLHLYIKIIPQNH